MARRRGHTWIVGLRFACSTSSRSVVKAGGHAGWAHVERGLFLGRLRGRVSRRQPNGDRAPEAVKDLVFDAVAEALTQLTGRRTPCYETVTAGTLWSLVRQPTTGRDDPERTPWTSCRGWS